MGRKACEATQSPRAWAPEVAEKIGEHSRKKWPQLGNLVHATPRWQSRLQLGALTTETAPVQS